MNSNQIHRRLLYEPKCTEPFGRAIYLSGPSKLWSIIKSVREISDQTRRQLGEKESDSENNGKGHLWSTNCVPSAALSTLHILCSLLLSPRCDHGSLVLSPPVSNYPCHLIRTPCPLMVVDRYFWIPSPQGNGSLRHWTQAWIWEERQQNVESREI